jgi:hypothetical protein
MASASKRKTTMAKLNRERKLLERRQEKQAKKAARKQAAAAARADPTTSMSKPEAPTGIEPV